MDPETFVLGFCTRAISRNRALPVRLKPLSASLMHLHLQICPRFLPFRRWAGAVHQASRRRIVFHTLLMHHLLRTRYLVRHALPAMNVARAKYGMCL